MTVYLGVFGALFLGGLSVSDRNSRIYLFLVFTFLLWFMGARYYVGCDFGGYFHRFLYTPADWSFSEIITHLDEPGFWLLTSHIKAQELSYMWLNVFASFLILCCFWIFLRAHRDRAMILALLFPVIILQLSMSGIRQGLAVGFLMVASVAWMRGKRLWTAAWILIGAQFHASVLMFLPIVLVAGKSVSTPRLIAAAAILGPVAVFLMSDRLETYADRYLDSDITSGGALIRYTLIMIPALFFVKYRRRLAEVYPEYYEFLKLVAVFSWSLLPVAVFSSILLHRVNYYIMPFSIVLFVYLSRVAYQGTSRTLVRALPGVTYGLYSTMWFLTSSHADRCYLPYNSYSFL